MECRDEVSEDSSYSQHRHFIRRNEKKANTISLFLMALIITQTTSTVSVHPRLTLDKFIGCCYTISVI